MSVFKFLPRKLKVRILKPIVKEVMEDSPDLLIRKILDKLEEKIRGHPEKFPSWDRWVERVDKDLENFPQLKPYRQYLLNTALNTLKEVRGDEGK